MTETQMELQNVKQIAQETCLAGIVLEETHHLLQLASLNVEMEFEQDLKPVMTGFRHKTIRNVSLTVQILSSAGHAKEQLDQFPLVILFVEITE